MNDDILDHRKIEDINVEPIGPKTVVYSGTDPGIFLVEIVNGAAVDSEYINGLTVQGPYISSIDGSPVYINTPALDKKFQSCRSIDNLRTHDSGTDNVHTVGVDRT